VATLTGHSGSVFAMAVGPDGTWLATGDKAGTIRIWDVATRRAQALMRVDGSVRACTWLGPNTLAVGGSAGLYLFDFLTATNSIAGAR
jgi:WD40 repeat protein